MVENCNWIGKTPSPWSIGEFDMGQKKFGYDAMRNAMPELSKL